MSDLSPEGKELLRAARASFSPSEARIAAVRAVLETQIGASVLHLPGAASVGPVATAATGGASWGAGHVIAMILIAAAAAGGAVVLASRHHPAPKPAVTLGAPSVPAAGALAGSALAEQPMSSYPAVPAIAPSSTPAPPSEGSAPPRAGHPPRRRRRPIEELQPPPDPASAAVAPPVAQSASRDSVEPAPPPSSKSPAESPEVADDSLAHEISLLRAARAALEGGDPEEALALLHRHARLWPHGVLAEERLATRVLALCALGRLAEARITAHQLESVAPHSPHLARVHASCAGDPPAGAP